MPRWYDCTGLNKNPVYIRWNFNNIAELGILLKMSSVKLTRISHRNCTNSTIIFAFIDEYIWL